MKLLKLLLTVIVKHPVFEIEQPVHKTETQPRYAPSSDGDSGGTGITDSLLTQVDNILNEVDKKFSKSNILCNSSVQINYV